MQYRINSEDQFRKIKRCHSRSMEGKQCAPSIDIIMRREYFGPAATIRIHEIATLRTRNLYYTRMANYGYPPPAFTSWKTGNVRRSADAMLSPFRFHSLSSSHTKSHVREFRCLDLFQFFILYLNFERTLFFCY